MFSYLIEGMFEHECDRRAEEARDPFIFHQTSEVGKALRPAIKAVIGWSVVCENLSQLQVVTCLNPLESSELCMFNTQNK